MKIFKLLSALLVLAGCSNRVTFPYEIPSNQKIIHQIDFYVWGSIGEGNVDILFNCFHGRAYQIHSYTSPLQALLSIVSFGIYVPKTVEVTCSGGVSKSGELKEVETYQQKNIPYWDRERFFEPPPKFQKPAPQTSDQR